MKSWTMLLSVACVCLLGAGAYGLQPAEAPATAPAKEPNLVFKTQPPFGADMMPRLAVRLEHFAPLTKESNAFAFFRLSLPVWREPNALSKIAASVPDSDFPSAKVREFLRSPDKLRPEPPTEGVIKGWRSSFEFMVPASSPEQVEELSRGVVAFWQTWWERHGQEYWRRRLQVMWKEFLDANEATAKAQKQWEEDKALLGLSENDTFPKATSDELKMKRTFLEVDIAGLQAKIAAAEKMQADLRDTGKLVELSNLLIAAKIELADLTARKGKIEAMIPAALRISGEDYYSWVRTKNLHAERYRSLREDLDAGTIPPPQAIGEPPGDTVRIYTIDWTTNSTPVGRSPLRTRLPSSGASSAPGSEAPLPPPAPRP
jgi:hypothetical protein